MGFNTSMIVLNDALGEIEKDPDFGLKLGNAIGRLSGPHLPHGIDISAGPNVNAATVIETHHADFTTLLAFGGNCVSFLQSSYGYRHNDEAFQVRLLHEWADKLGYEVKKKRK